MRALYKRAQNFYKMCIWEQVMPALPFSFLLWALGSNTWLYYLFCEAVYKYATYIAIQDFFFSFIISLIIYRLPQKRVRTISITIVFVIYLLLFILSLYCFKNLHYILNFNYISAILNTNAAEAYEFLQSYVDIHVGLLLVSSALLAFILFCFIINRQILIPKPIAFFSFILAIAGGCSLFYNPGSFKDNTVRLITYFFELSRVPSLQKYYGKAQIIVTSDNQPEKVILIIGESLAKSHCYAYGYDKNTTPYISSLIAQDDIIVYSNASSAALTTIPSFIAMMSSYKPEMGDSLQWYEYPTLPEIIRKSGYHCTWISNQSKKGIWDNEIGKFAEICDSSIFVGNQTAGTQKADYDEIIIPELESCLINDDYTKDFYILHLMGSHPAFNKRFPSSFNVFISSDYTDKQAAQRQLLADYDNSVLYNDSIFFSIIEKIKEEDAIVVYFSDHGLDIYDSSPDYIGHGIADNDVSAKVASEVPMYVYCSPSFKSKHEDLYWLMKGESDSPFYTRNLIEWLMRIMSCKYSSLSILNG